MAQYLGPRAPCGSWSVTRRKVLTTGTKMNDSRFALLRTLKSLPRGIRMKWTSPVLVEIAIGLEINGYLPAEF